MTNGIYTYYDVEKCKIVYVGRDSHIDKSVRHKAHLSKSRCDDQPFNSILQNNPDRYHYSVLKEGNYDNDTLNAMEKYYINIYDTFENGYNFTLGGDKDYTVSEETRTKQSKAMSGKNHWNYGKTRSKEQKDKQSKAMKGKPKSEEHKAKIGKANINKLPIIRKNNKQNRWTCTLRYNDSCKNKIKNIRRKSLTDCINKVDEFLNSEQNNLGLIMPIIEIDIEEEN